MSKESGTSRELSDYIPKEQSFRDYTRLKLKLLQTKNPRLVSLFLPERCL